MLINNLIRELDLKVFQLQGRPLLWQLELLTLNGASSRRQASPFSIRSDLRVLLFSRCFFFLLWCPLGSPLWSPHGSLNAGIKKEVPCFAMYLLLSHIFDMSCLLCFRLIFHAFIVCAFTFKSFSIT